MCLEIKHDAIPKIAETDIVCYKHIKGSKTARSGYCTPYQRDTVKFNKILETGLIKRGDNIREGFHSFKTLLACKQDAYDEDSVAIVMCIIPKDSSYYEGKFGRYKSYASDKIFYGEIILEKRKQEGIMLSFDAKFRKIKKQK